MALAVSALLFAVVFSLTVLHERDTGLHTFYSVPIAVLALELGLAGGIVGGAVAAALFGLEVLYEGDGFEPGGWVLRPAAFMTLGLVVGFLAQRGRRESDARARLAQERGQLVARILRAEEEAKREIAQVLHDDALQSLLAANHELIEAGSAGKQAGAAQEALRRAIERVREVAHALHPVTLEHGGLEAALAAVAREAGNRAGFRPTLRIDPGATDGGGRAELLVSVARELIANAARHSRAGEVEVSVSLGTDAEAIVLEVCDDGEGIAPGRRAAALRNGHIGLASIEQRLTAIGGRFELHSSPGDGTRARAEVPVAGGARAHRTA